ncbi:MAG: CsiV family protein, partial [Gammaproteobacteria bacterium]
MNRLSNSLLLTALLSSVLSPVRAAAPAANTASNTSWYDVELIVFRYTDPQAGDMESWPVDPGISGWNAASALLPLPTTDTTPATSNAASALTPLMQIDAHQLDNAWNRLKNSHDYEPLLHVAWVEPLTDHSNAVSVRVGVPPPPPATTSIPGLIVAPLPASASAVTGTPAPIPTPVYG